MKVLVIAGSPKGEVSVTRQYVRYLENQLPEHDWTVVDVASRINKLERDQAAFDAIVEQVRQADMVLWAFPVYVLLVPAGYKRFIELIFEHGVEEAFGGKYAASLSTSIHFHDNCAHDYIRAVSEDLDMHFVGSHSPEMMDLQKEEARRQLLTFGRQILQCAQDRAQPQRRFRPPPQNEWSYQPGPVDDPVDSGGRRVVIVHDATEDQANLQGMIERLRGSFGGEVETINLREIEIKGNCLGCLRCASENQCAYEGKDGFIDFYNRVLMQADILVFAGAIVDRHLSSRWRQLFERGFFNTHMPSFPGKQLAFLVAGPMSHMANLREFMTGYAQLHEGNLVDVISDEESSSTLLDKQLTSLAGRLVGACLNGYVQPFDFMGVGGRKIFRDHIFGPLRFVFLADHRYYVRTGFYDFPTRNWGMRLLNVVLVPLLSVRQIRRVFDKKIKEQMIRPLIKWAEAEKKTSSP